MQRPEIRDIIYGTAEYELQFLGAFLKKCEKRLLPSSCLSVRMSAWNSAPIERISMTFYI